METVVAATHPDINNHEPFPQHTFAFPSNREFYESEQYKDLDRSKEEIRLLQLLPIKDDEPVKATLVTVVLQPSGAPPPKYSAVSYFVGNHAEIETLLVDDIPFSAFASLVRALRQIGRARERLALSGYSQLIWADQICINQSNASERSHQVGFMRRIYEYADMVLACLGEDQTDGQWVRAANRLNIESSYENISLQDRTLSLRGRVFGNFRDEDFQQDWRSMSALLQSPWWQRGWIYQEIIVAQRITVFFGDCLMDWQILSPAILFMDHVISLMIHQMHRGQNSIHENETDNFAHSRWFPDGLGPIVCDREEWQKTREKNLVQLLAHAQDCLVTDPRDRVFAFVGIANPQYSITPDYGSDELALATSVCKRIIIYERWLNILCCCNSNSGWKPRREGIPSWAPDWCLPEFKGFDFVYDLVEDFPPFRSSSDYRSAAVFRSLGDVSDGILQVQCLFVDSLAKEGLAGAPCEAESKDRLGDWRSLAGFGRNPEEECYPHNPSISSFHAYVEATLRGRSRYSRPDDDFMEEMAYCRKESIEFGQFFCSSKGYLGMAKRGAELRHTDMICVLLGANVPFILRQVNDHLELISDVYVEGLMYGEAIEMMERGELVVEAIDIH